MSFSLVNNIQSQSSQTSLSRTSASLASTIQRLSSGLRINNSGDDAAGLAIANKFRSDIATLSQGIRNANDGVSALQILDGGLNTISTLLDRATTLATQSASDSFTGDRDTLNNELSKVTAEITRQAKNIGLASTGGADSRFNKALSVFIGGGVDAAGATNTVGVNLAGANRQVDAVGLGLNALNIGATAVPTSATTFTAAVEVGLNASTTATAAAVTTAQSSTTATSVNVVDSTAAGGAADTILSDEQLTFTGADGKIFSVNLTGGQDLTAIAAAINGEASNTFVTAADDGAGRLTLTAQVAGTPQSFTVSSNRAASDANQTGLNGASVDYHAANTIAADERLTFYVGSQQFNVDLLRGDSVDDIVSKINSSTSNTYGIVASNVAGAVTLTSSLTDPNSADFTVVSNRTGVTSSGLNNMSVDYTRAAITADENLTFTVGSSTFAVALKSGDTAAQVAAKINSATGNIYGIQASVGSGSNASLNTISLTANVADSDAASFSVASDKTGAGSSRLDGGSVTVTSASGGVAGASNAIALIKAAIATLGTVQGAVGAGQNNLMQAIDLATSQTTNFQAAESRLRDADVSAEASTMSRLNVLQQAGVAALAQANQMSQAVLTLLR
jgi:flagellin